MTLLLMLPGCALFTSKKNGAAHTVSQKAIMEAQQWIRTLYIYDQFTTNGFFVVLPLTKLVQYCSYILHRTYVQTTHQLNYSSPAFIVLSSYQSPLFSDQCGWKLCLEYRGKKYENPLIRGIELPCEFRLLFGNYYNSFKSAYLVVFEGEGMLIGKEGFKLTFYSATTDKTIVWKNKEQKGV